MLPQPGTTFLVQNAVGGRRCGDEVYHPSRTGDKVGDVVDRYPELDVAMIQLTPSTSTRFQNNAYFRATTPTRLVDSETIPSGSFFEVDSMSTGLVEFMFEIVTMEKPFRPPGHPPVPCIKWRRYNVMQGHLHGNRTLRCSTREWRLYKSGWRPQTAKVAVYVSKLETIKEIYRQKYHTLYGDFFLVYNSPDDALGVNKSKGLKVRTMPAPKWQIKGKYRTSDRSVRIIATGDRHSCLNVSSHHANPSSR